MIIERIWTIGYERLLPEMLVGELRQAGIGRLIDVRIRPQSRRPGMSKTKLGERLGAQGISYEHRRELGTPVEIRTLYRRGAVRAAAEAYRAHLEANAAGEIERLAADLAGGPPTSLLCLEAEPAHCHRRVICEALRDRLPELVVIDL